MPLAHDVAELLALGVTSIINCAATTPAGPDGLGDYGTGPAGVELRRDMEEALRAARIPETQLDIHVSSANMNRDGAELSEAWAHYVAHRHRGVVLVHCRFGQDRSASVLAGILSKRDAMGGGEAIELLRKLSGLAQPDPRIAELIDRWLMSEDEKR